MTEDSDLVTHFRMTMAELDADFLAWAIESGDPDKMANALLAHKSAIEARVGQ